MALTACARGRGQNRREKIVAARRVVTHGLGRALCCLLFFLAPSSRLRGVVPLVPLDAAAAATFITNLKFDKDGLVPVIAQDVATGVVRMFAWATAEALRATFDSGAATFFSRSRQSLWRKGEESGNVLAVREVRLDCDGDVVLYLCEPTGPSCHTGATSCFYRVATAEGLREDGGPPEVAAAITGRLAQVIKQRRRESADKSYVASLLQKGFPKINAKITEEAREVTEAFLEGDKPHITHEVADVLFHVMVGLEAAEIPIDDVWAELRRRFGVGGHVEKASRG
jgi:phosphoribosyl-ATP pyrophosphohydrolase/phosphoribosyl-AMP cyclohydrolase